MLAFFRPKRVFDGAVPAPERVSIETTRFCNLRCPMCLPFLAGSTVRGPHMEPEFFERLAREIFPFVRYWQPSVSGEPAVTPNFADMVELAGRYGVKLDMVTNGTRLSGDEIRRIVPHLARVFVSFDSVDPETFEQIREGARFDKVVETVRRFVQATDELVAPERRPRLGINCTIMRRNVDRLPDLVDFAANDLGLDIVTVSHLYPASEDMREQSLVHDVDRARTRFDESLRRAKANGIHLHVQALDLMTAAAAMSDTDHREVASRDGVVDGLAERVWGPGSDWELPEIEPDDDAEALRAEALEASRLPAPIAPRNLRPVKLAEPISWCEFLWKRSYVDTSGDVRACCVPGAPVMGNVKLEPFDELWNNANYRALRRRLVERDPVSVCRGCQHVQEVSDPMQVAEILQGCAKVGDDPVPTAMAEPCFGRWNGFVVNGDETRRVEVRVAEDRSVEIAAPWVERGWVRAHRVELDGFGISFHARIGGLEAEFVGRAEHHLNSIDGEFRASNGTVLAARLNRIRDFRVEPRVDLWQGTLHRDGRDERIGLRLLSQDLGMRAGWIDHEAEGLVDVPVQAWDSNDSACGVQVEYCGAQLHYAGYVIGDRFEGRVALGKSGSVPFELERVTV